MSRLAAYFGKLWKNSGKILYSADCSNYRQLQVDRRLITRLGYILINLRKQMDKGGIESLSGITPPDSVRGMTQLRREAFTKVVRIPAVRIPKREISRTRNVWKTLQLKLREIKPIAELSDSDPNRQTHSLLLLDPDKLDAEKLSENQKTLLENFGLDLKNPSNFELELNYNNWTLSDIMKAVLPSEADSVSSFTQIGHIAHLNLKEKNLPYKTLIGEVILDKIRTVKTVVNKEGIIDNTFRNFKMDLLAGEENYVTQIKEHNCVFELDFSKVYWNSRLSAEHHHVVELIEKDSVVYDVFAGVGPFAVPLAKKKQCIVFANDLNPSSYEYLKKNIQLNKIVPRLMETYNMDGREFIKLVVKKDLVNRILKAITTELHSNSAEKTDDKSDQALLSGDTSQAHDGESESKIRQHIARCSPAQRSYVIMNLPAIATDFLDSFKLLLQDLPTELKVPDVIDEFSPHVICYAFTSKDCLYDDFDDLKKDLQGRVEAALGQPLPNCCDIRVVRNVAPNKEMVCISFKLWSSVLVGSPDGEMGKQEKDLNSLVAGGTENQEKDFADFKACEEPESKRQKFSA